MVIGTPARPSEKGPHGIFDAGVVRRLWSMHEADIMNAERYAESVIEYRAYDEAISPLGY